MHFSTILTYIVSLLTVKCASLTIRGRPSQLNKHDKKDLLQDLASTSRSKLDIANMKTQGHLG
jgi:hypothetical protein